MANEFRRLPNPDNVPGAVTSGYQRQNINICAIQTGLDTTSPYDSGNNTVTIPADGIVELNGVMFKLTSDVNLSAPSNTQPYWIAIADNGDGTASAQLVERPGVWSFAKQGCYLPDGRRTLNKWVYFKSAPTSVITVPGLVQAIYHNSQTFSPYIFSLLPGWYHLHLESGKGAGNGGLGAYGSAGGAGGAGGVPLTYKSVDLIFFDDGKKYHCLKIGANGENGYDGENGANGGGGGGGGGSGGGDESTFDDISTGFVPPGNGGGGGRGANGPGNSSDGGMGGAGGVRGGLGMDGIDGVYITTPAGAGGHGGITSGGYSGSGGGGGGGGGLHMGDAGGVGGNGGDGGMDGAMRSQGPPSGLCRIMRIE